MSFCIGVVVTSSHEAFPLDESAQTCGGGQGSEGVCVEV